MFIDKLKIYFFKLLNKFFDYESVYYINGPSVLPPPLDTKQEAEYAR